MTTADRLDASETVYRYAYGLDLKDYALHRSILADEILMDYSAYTQQPARTMPADAWVAGIQRVFDNLAGTQHAITNPLCEVDGDTARFRGYVRAHHVYDTSDPQSWYTLGGMYDHTLARSDTGPKGWLVTGVTLAVLWEQGDQNIMTLAAKGKPA